MDARDARAHVLMHFSGRVRGDSRDEGSWVFYDEQGEPFGDADRVLVRAACSEVADSLRRQAERIGRPVPATSRTRAAAPRDGE